MGLIHRELCRTGGAISNHDIDLFLAYLTLLLLCLACIIITFVRLIRVFHAGTRIAGIAGLSVCLWGTLAFDLTLPWKGQIDVVIYRLVFYVYLMMAAILGAVSVASLVAGRTDQALGGETPSSKSSAP